MDNDVPSCGSDSFVSSASQNASTDGVRWFGSIGRWVCTHNPFYVISAALVFAGLRISFGPETQNAHPLGLAIGVSSYTMLLAVTSYLLVRYGKVWDDVRSLLLLIVLLLVSLSE